MFFAAITLSAFGDFHNFTVKDGRAVELEIRSLNYSRNEVTVKTKNGLTKFVSLDLFNDASQQTIKAVAADNEFLSSSLQFKVTKKNAESSNTEKSFYYEIELKNRSKAAFELEVACAVFSQEGEKETALETMDKESVTLPANSTQVVTMPTFTFKSTVKSKKTTWPEVKGVWVRVGRPNYAGEMVYRDFKNPPGIDNSFDTSVFEAAKEEKGGKKTDNAK
jgi:hypothetical protein